VDPLDHDLPSEWLEARSALFAWDRVTGKVCLSDLLSGRQILDVTDLLFADSLKIRMGETPLSRLSVQVRAEWIQEGTGEINLTQKIAAAFSGGMINTLTPESLIKGWPGEGQKLGASGYWVASSHLHSATPPRTGILNIYPTVTPELTTWDEETGAPKQHRLRRFWMVGKLVLGWRYRQKRRECVHFTLVHKTQLGQTIRPLTRTLTLRLQSLGLPPWAGTFFLTTRGRQAVEHALEMAKAHLAASSRCIEMEMMVPFEAGFCLSLDHSVRLVDSRIPGGQGQGKVVAYQLVQEGLTSFAWIRAAACIGVPLDTRDFAPKSLYVESAYGEIKGSAFHQTPSGLIYEDYTNQRPLVGIGDLETLSIHDIVREIWVSGDAQRQIRALKNNQYPVRHHLKSVLQEIPTVISFDLLSLKTQAVIEHTIHLNVGEWSAPQQIYCSKKEFLP
jgi:hypothetical protein